MAESPQSKVESPWRIDAWFPDISEGNRTKLKAYSSELVRANKLGNLVSPKTMPLADAIHFSDGIVGGRIVLNQIQEGSTIFDFGSGAGFPGLVMAILSPKHNFALVENDLKKVDFLRGVLATLGLANVVVRNGGVESIESASVQFGVVRGFANISKTILLLRRCFVNGGSLFHFKGEQWSMEVGEIPTQLCSVWTPALVAEYKLPIGPMKFGIVKTTKIQK